ncbi:YggT family protein [Synechococcus sp. UW105]|jgi:YggT family protein|uniref:YggT family protein n=1 Tax=unclassified Synechococcus TaxID=2626047 RepID=UPI000C8B9EC4|nr:YggT family protein [Synechococcus sp. UW105]MAS27449.1 YggT family protein [Synechococcus sp. NAT40]RZO13127.1 MAG: YggT family protein [Synechococcus sp. MED-G135]|tara:strand:- start:56 stop:367 length:312 start_codon:yes stop_codon:yes gene_type:complete
MSAEVIGYLVNLLGVISSALEIYFYVLVIRVLLSWFPNVDQSNPLISTLSSITDPYLNAFRGIIPPLGGLDLSAILAFIALNVFQWALGNAQMALLNSPSFYS